MSQTPPTSRPTAESRKTPGEELAALRQELRRLRWACAAASTVAALALTVAAWPRALAADVPDSLRLVSVETHALRLVDTDDNVRASLGFDGRRPELVFYDTALRPTARIRAGTEGPAVDLFGPDGRPRASLGVDEDGSQAWVTLRGAAPDVMMGLDSTRGPYVATGGSPQWFAPLGADAPPPPRHRREVAP